MSDPEKMALLMEWEVTRDKGMADSKKLTPLAHRYGVTIEQARDVINRERVAAVSGDRGMTAFSLRRRHGAA